jgi:type III secretion system HrpE/YscL family protein
MQGGPPPGIAPARVPGMTQSFNRGLIKQQVVGAYGQAKEILSVAEQEAARIIQDAERIREEQARAGWEEGHRKGYEEALAGLARFEEETHAAFADLEQKIVQLSMRVAEKIIGAEMATRPDAIAAIVAQALKTVRHQKDVIIRVNPAQVPALEEHKKTLLGALSRAKDVSIRGDPALRPGGCVIETELGILDADLQTQMEILERALQGGIPKTNELGGPSNGGEGGH